VQPRLMPWLNSEITCRSIDPSHPYIPPIHDVSKQSCSRFMRLTISRAMNWIRVPVSRSSPLSHFSAFSTRFLPPILTGQRDMGLEREYDCRCILIILVLLVPTSQTNLIAHFGTTCAGCSLLLRIVLRNSYDTQ